MKRLLILILCFAVCPAYAALAQSSVSENHVLTRIVVDKKTGYIDREGKVIIPPQFHRADDFSEGLAAFEIKIDLKEAQQPTRPPDEARDRANFIKAGYIDQTGKVVITPSFWSAGTFSEGLASVSVIDLADEFYKNARRNTFHLGGPPTKFGYIDVSGKFVIEPQFETAYPFHEGRAFVITSAYKWGYIDRSGRMIIGPFHFPSGYSRPTMCNFWFRPAMLGVELPDDFSEGLVRIIKDGKLAYIDQSGASVIETKFGVFGSSKFSEGLARVRVGGKFISPFGSADEVDGKFGFIDRTGKFVIEPQFDITGEFVEGLAPAALKGKDGEEKWGYIDKTGRMVIQPKFTFASNFSDGLARVVLEGKYYFIDRTDKIILQTEFDYVDDFEKGLAWFREDSLTNQIVEGKPVRMGYIDKSGKIVWQQFDK